MPGIITAITPDRSLCVQYELGVNMIQKLAADTTNLVSNKGFSASDAGTVQIRPRGDALPVHDYPVVAGVVYPIDIIDFSQANSVPNTISLYVHRQGG